VRYDPYAGFEKTVLPNGLTVYNKQQDKPFVAMDFIVHAGGREDQYGKEGVSHFVEHMVSRNVRGYPSYAENREFFRKTGGGASFGTTSHFSTRYDFMLPDDLPTLFQGIEIFANMLVFPRLEKELEKQKDVVVGEIWRKHENPQLMEFGLKAVRSVLGDHRIARASGLGLEETVRAFDYPSLQSFCDEFYAPPNISIVCVGGVCKDDLIPMLQESRFGKVSGGRRNPLHNARIAPKLWVPNNRLLEAKAKDVGKKIELLEYNAGWALPCSVSKDAIELVHKALSEALFDEIREADGLTYDISVDWWFYQDFHLIEVEGKLHPSCVGSIDGRVRKTIEKVAQDSARLRDQVERRIKQFNFTDPSTVKVCDIVASQVALEDKVTTSAEDLEDYRSLADSDFDGVFEYLLGPHTVTTLIVP
jgi:predicted Zn-dependent peptidase